jgi:hypothetical protein
VSRDFTFTITSGANSAFEGSTTATVGARGSWGKMAIDAVVNNGFFESGPDFIGGTAPGVSSFVSVTYGLD